MNSFSAMQKAIEFEVERQVAALRAGRGAEEVVQETRLWDEGAQRTYSMRRKEGLADYRYFPEPDLPPLVLSQGFVDELQVSMAGRGGGRLVAARLPAVSLQSVLARHACGPPLAP